MNLQIRSVSTCKRRDEHSKGVQNSDEVSRRVDKSPWVDDVSNDTHDDTTSCDVYPSRNER